MTTETLPEARPFEPTTPIRPSEAMRLGCLIAPKQHFDGYFNRSGNAACAVGAASLGWGIEYFDAEFRLQQIGDVPCPAGDCGHYGYPSILNDTHRWSRERIADWLAEQGL